jgi:hypothetical protein
VKKKDFAALVAAFANDDTTMPDKVVVWNQWDDTYHEIQDVTVDDTGVIIVEVER